MKKWLFSLLCIALIGGGVAYEAWADNANVKTGSAWCYGLVTPKAIIQPLVQCFTDTTQGIIPSVTRNFINNVKADYLPTVGVMLLLVIVYHGLKVMTGDVQRLKGETVVLGLKMGGVLLFMNEAPVLYTDMINILQGLSESISQAATSVHGSGFCTGAMVDDPADNSGWQNGLWQRWDCIFSYLLGFSAVGFATASIASFLLLIMFSMGTGVLVFFMALALILALLTSAFRFIHIYLMAVLSLSFMFCIGYMFVPLLLFKYTFDYFRKWFIMMFGFVLTPIIMFGFMGMMLVAIDIVLFSGQFSVFCEIGGNAYCQLNKGNQATGTGGGFDIFKNITQNMIPAVGGAGGNNNLKKKFAALLYLSVNNTPGITTTSGGIPVIPGTDPCAGQVNTGSLGFVCNILGKGSDFKSQDHPEQAKLGADMTELNLTTIAANANGNVCTTANDGVGPDAPANQYYNNCPWITDVLVSITVAVLIIYIMLSLLTYIPTLASNLTADLLSNDMATKGIGMFKTAVFGEDMGQGLLGVGKEAATGASEGLAKGGVGGAVEGAAGKSWRAIAAMLAGDR